VVDASVAGEYETMPSQANALKQRVFLFLRELRAKKLIIPHRARSQARRDPMAQIEGEPVVVHLSLGEKFGALHGDLHFPRSAGRAARVVDKPFAEIQVPR